MASENHSGFIIADIQISPSQNKMSTASQAVSVQPKVMEVLNYLALNHQRVISKEELIENVWAGRVVTHGSVQKSINSLRKAFAQFLGDTEVIVNYSKRGYQLKIQPTFIDPSIENPIEPSAPAGLGVKSQSETSISGQPSDLEIINRPSILQRNRIIAGVVLCLALGSVVVAWQFVHSDKRLVDIPKSHKTEFSQVRGYTNETGHERSAYPHGNGLSVVYVRDKFDPTDFRQTESQLVIRDQFNKDWLIDSVEGSWYKMSWSSNFDRLLAIEVKRKEGQPLTPDFNSSIDYLYNLFVFELDLESTSVISKKLITQWQGRVYSVDWWGEQIIEIVAKQGAEESSKRYRYNIDEKLLTRVGSLSPEETLLQSAVNNKVTAIASYLDGSVVIRFLSADDKLIGEAMLDTSLASMSWIPDGSGVLVRSSEGQLALVYLNEEVVRLDYQSDRDKSVMNARFGSDGQSIFLTEKTYRSEIWLNNHSDEVQVTSNGLLNYSAYFAKGGDHFIYASVRNNQNHLWMVENEREVQLTRNPIQNEVTFIQWVEKDSAVFFKAGSSLYYFAVDEISETVVGNVDTTLRPLSYYSESNSLVALSGPARARNIWLYDFDSDTALQKTFGSIGSAIVKENSVYFQYVNKKGLWRLGIDEQQPEVISQDLQQNSNLLYVDNMFVYFITGGVCRESSIYRMNIESSNTEVFLERKSNFVSTDSFHPSVGVLQTRCYLAESNIVVLE